MTAALEGLLRSLQRQRVLEGATIELEDRLVRASRDELSVVALSSEAIERDPSCLARLDGAREALVVLGPRLPEALRRAALPFAGPLSLWPGPLDADAGEALGLVVAGLLERLSLRAKRNTGQRQLWRARYERAELVEIARAITQERDIDPLLNLILEKSRYITGADAGSIYVVEGDPEAGGQSLRFKLSQNDSVSFESSEFAMPVSKESIAGSAVLERRAINIADVHAADRDASLSYRFDPSFDRRAGYRTVSMLAVPMISAEDEVIGVVQLINKKRDPRAKLRSPQDVYRHVVAFDAESEELLHALGAQAGIALENALLYDEVQNIFEGFVRASVQAIEQRDPTTSGHSQRVSVLSCALAQAVDRADSGPLRDLRFSPRDLKELEYAALLHDFGKIGVREQILVKAKKLHPYERASIRARIEYALKSAEADRLGERLAALEQGAGQSDLDRIEERHARRARDLEQAWRLVDRSNEPTVLSEGDFSRIARVGALRYRDADGFERPLLTEIEMTALQVTRGSLTPSEMDEIRSHVRHTYDFLRRIPWGKSMRRIPEIAGAHHEKLNGSGYPHGLETAAIPLASKVMTIADIYDALTAHDRPYKKALPDERALQILRLEVEDGNLDSDLVGVFVESRLYAHTRSERVR